MKMNDEQVCFVESLGIDIPQNINMFRNKNTNALSLEGFNFLRKNTKVVFTKLEFDNDISAKNIKAFSYINKKPYFPQSSKVFYVMDDMVIILAKLADGDIEKFLI